MMYRFLRAAVPVFTVLPFRMRFLHKDRIPGGGAVLAGNHTSYFDPVVICLGPWRQVHFMAKRQLFEDHKALGWLMRRVDAFPVSQGSADRAAIAKASGLVRSGELVGIFPEGTRRHTGNVTDLQGGAALISLRTGVPVVPVGVHGTDGIWPKGRLLPHFRRIVTVFGEPVRPEVFSAGGRKERVTAMTDAIMEGIDSAVREAAVGEEERK